MAEVADHLAPRDGLTNSSVALAGLDTIPGRGGAIVRFDITDEQQSYLGTFSIEVGPQPAGTTDAVIVEAHRRMTDVLRQWLYSVDQIRQGYESPPDRSGR